MNSLILLPWLLDFKQVAPFILRVVLGITLAYFGYRKAKGIGQSSGSNSRAYGYTEVLVGVFLVVGLFTQLAALINVVILLIKIGIKISEKKFLTDGINYYVLLLAIAMALLFIAPGMFAIDSLI